MSQRACQNPVKCANECHCRESFIDMAIQLLTSHSDGPDIRIIRMQLKANPLYLDAKAALQQMGFNLESTDEPLAVQDQKWTASSGIFYIGLSVTWPVRLLWRNS